MRSDCLPFVLGTVLTIFMSACKADAEAKKPEEYRQYLRDHYQGSEIQPISYSTDFDSDAFVFHDLLIGDFNHDGAEDFAAELLQMRTQAEASKDEVPARRSVLTISSAVVCHGRSDSQDPPTDDFDCSYLQEPYAVGGINGELAFVTVVPDNLSDDRLSSGEKCTSFRDQWRGKRVLSLVNSSGGYCLSLYYPDPDSTSYSECVYCAD